MEIDKTCKNCENCVEREGKLICSVPIWKDSNLYQMHYTEPEETCNLFDERKK